MSKLVFQANLGGSVTLDGPNISTAVNFVLPSADGAANTVITTNGSGTLSFQAVPNITSAANLTGGSAGTVPYQSASGTTAMLAAGTTGQFLKSNGAAAPSWDLPPTSIVRSTKTANYTLTSSDKGNLVVATSGTFTFAFTAAATLGSGWCVYLQNNGTGDITLDPNGSETIDGLTSYVMYPGEARLVQCDGSGFNTVVLNTFYKTFTSSGTFVKPPGYLQYSGLLWGGGGGGSKDTSSTQGSGGGGGNCLPFTSLASGFSSSQTITIGAGGAATSTDGGNGGNSSIGSLFTSYGGGGAVAAGNAGSGGGALSAGSAGIPGKPYNSASPRSNSGFGGAGDPSTDSAWGGAAGSTTSAGGQSVWGGGGGSAAQQNLAGGTSVFGGAGGAGSASGTAGAGTAPSGGGGGTYTGSSGAGARGELRIWGII
jgi:hypothetical protein